MAQKWRYSDLMDYAVNYIKTTCNNIDSLKNIPGDVRNGYSSVIATSTKQRATETVTDSTAFTVVSSTTVRNELTKYLQTYGVYSKAGTVMSAKGILNFFNYVASFLSGHLMLLTNNLTSGKVCLYKTGSVTIPSVSKMSEDVYAYTDKTNFGKVKFTTSNNTENVTSIMNAINHTTNVKSTNVLLNFASSSSSSSSSSCSSSSCSSSCCSSSSSYIVYMMI